MIKTSILRRLSQGRYVTRLQQYMQEQFDGKDITLLDSGSSAITLALRSFKALHPERDTVIVPVYICPSVIRAVTRAGLTPRFVPVGDDLVLTPESLEGVLNDNTLAVIIPHLYGYPVQIDECLHTIKQADPSIFIIDDAAAAFGTVYQNRKLGTWGDAGVFSFGPSKQLTATGGGALLISNAELLDSVYEHTQHLALFSEKDVFLKFLDFWWKFVCIRYSPAMTYWYKKIIPSKPRSSHSSQSKNMSNLDAALILWLSARKDKIAKQRNQIIAYYIQGLNHLPECVFPQIHAPSFCVSRFYMRMSGIVAERDSKGQIIKDNPLLVYLRSQGIRAGYGYSTSETHLGPEGSRLRQEQHAWLDELIWLPVDHKKKLSQYATVVKAILSFHEKQQQFDESADV